VRVEPKPLLRREQLAQSPRLLDTAVERAALAALGDEHHAAASAAATRAAHTLHGSTHACLL